MTEDKKMNYNQTEYVNVWVSTLMPGLPFDPHPNVSRVVHMDRHIGSVDSFHTADGDALCLILVLISRLPEGLSGAVCQATDHGRTTGCLDVHYIGQVLQTGHQAEILSPHTQNSASGQCR